MKRALLVTLALWVPFGCDDKSDGSKPSRTEKASKPASPSKKGADTSAKTDADPKGDTKAPAAPAWAWKLPAGHTAPPAVPEDNPMSADKVALGHKLFMDKRLSADGSRSCYSCHQNHLGAADGRATALGAKAKPLTRNSPTIWNVGLQTSLYWDGRAPTLEKQAIGALKGGNMGLGDGLADKASEIGALPEYAAEFAKVFGLAEGAKVEPDHVAMALSAYERTLLCGDSAYDKQTLDEAATRGQKLFMGKAGCVTCHNGPNFSDGIFHVTGIAIDPKDDKADVGRFKVSSDAKDKYAFKTPTLRNVSRTAPYFHDGSVATLEEAVRTMASGGTSHEGLIGDPLLLDRKLSDAEIGDLVAFLTALQCPGELEVIGDQTADGIAAAPTG